jgi:hypothetical protein
MAQHAIRIKVGDIQPGTPAPAFQSMQQVQGGFQGQFGGGNDQFNPQQWSAPANGYVQNPQVMPGNQSFGQQGGFGQNQFGAPMSTGGQQQYPSAMRKSYFTL